MEHLVVQFLHDLQKESTEKLNEATLDTIEIAFTQEQLTKFVQSFMGIVCRKISECQAYGVKNQQETQQGYFKIIQRVIARDDMLAGWLESPNF